jgi:ABC-type dipeptide/oligopeptide/nickel transport system ATPase component
MADNTPLLEVRDLSVEIDALDGTNRVLDHVSISVQPGEPMGLVGESGSGKSMTLMAIMGLLPTNARVVSGEVQFRGRDVLHGGKHQKYLKSIRGQGISMVFQEPSVALNPVLRVGRQITDAIAERRGISRRDARELAIQLMGQVGIVEPETRVDAYPFELSGGMRQRVMIAAAIACEPEMLLCDEPTTALDVTVQAQVVALFASLQKERHLGLLYVTHDLAVVAQLCTSLSVMRVGQILETGKLQAIFDDPQHEYTRSLLLATPRIDGEKQVPGTPVLQGGDVR